MRRCDTGKVQLIPNEKPADPGEGRVWSKEAVVAKVLGTRTPVALVVVFVLVSGCVCVSVFFMLGVSVSSPQSGHMQHG